MIQEILNSGSNIALFSLAVLPPCALFFYHWYNDFYLTEFGPDHYDYIMDPAFQDGFLEKEGSLDPSDFTDDTSDDDNISDNDGDKEDSKSNTVYNQALNAIKKMCSPNTDIKYCSRDDSTAGEEEDEVFEVNNPILGNIRINDNLMDLIKESAVRAKQESKSIFGSGGSGGDDDNLKHEFDAFFREVDEMFKNEKKEKIE